jgi:hypothetical protein
MHGGNQMRSVGNHTPYCHHQLLTRPLYTCFRPLQVSQFKRPAQPLQLYEFEGCPFCRKVREAACACALCVATSASS